MELNFYDTEIAFKSKTNKELKSAYYLFTIMKNRGLVKTGSKLLINLLNINLPVSWVVEATIYKHFVGGRTITGCQPVVEKLSNYNVKSILDFSVEGNTTPEGIDLALEETLRTIDNASKNPNIPFAVFKPSAFASPHLFEHAFRGKTLDSLSNSLYNDFINHVDTLCRRAYDLGVPIMIDAEESWYQHLVDETVEKMMRKYNHQRAIVYNTLQMYRHDRIDFLKESIEKARHGNYFLGVKFVRGAYMEKERFRALLKGYPSPICNTKKDTDLSYNEALKITLDNLDICELFSGTHNEESNMKLVSELKQRNIAPNDRRIWTSQLYGMSDHISYNMAHHGYNIAKYIPYGPVKSVLPYLIRRAEENTAIAGQTTRELSLLQLELERRRFKRS